MHWGLVVVVVVFLWLVLKPAKSSNAYSDRTYIVRYSKPSCPYCVNSQDEWNKFKRKAFADKLQVTIVDVDLTQNTDLVKHWKGRFVPDSVPTVVKFRRDTKVVYDGVREHTAYMAFAKN